MNGALPFLSGRMLCLGFHNGALREEPILFGTGRAHGRHPLRLRMHSLRIEEAGLPLVFVSLGRVTHRFADVSGVGRVK